MLELFLECSANSQVHWSHSSYLVGRHEPILSFKHSNRNNLGITSKKQLLVVIKSKFSSMLHFQCLCYCFVALENHFTYRKVGKTFTILYFQRDLRIMYKALKLKTLVNNNIRHNFTSFHPGI